MISFEQVSFTYSGSQAPALNDVDLAIPEGELCLVVGHTGSGKSTLLGLMNGLVPHFTGGTLAGRVVVDGRSTSEFPPRELADVIGHVSQEPLAGFVTDTVEEELAYSMEQLGIAPDVMRKRVEETLDVLGIAELRHRPLRTLSGGQQQRVAIGSALTAHPRVLVLDEPTSALDPTAAEEVLSAVTRLCHDLGVTVVMAEHRLERVVQFADQVIAIGGDRSVSIGDPRAMFELLDIAPPVVELGRLAGWSPLPLTVRDARRVAGDLRTVLASSFPAGSPRSAPDGSAPGGIESGGLPDPLLTAREIVVAYGPALAVRGVSLDLAAGEVTALMGRNGSGKSSLMWAIQGSGPRSGGMVSVEGHDPGSASSAEARGLVGLVPQSPSDLLYRTTVEDECAQADRESGSTAGATFSTATGLVGHLDPAAHPRDLSEGQRLGLVLAIQLAARPRVILLDEPTRGLDYRAKERLGGTLTRLAAEGRSVLLSTHDVEFVASVADRVAVMAEGEVVAEGATAEVITSSPAFAPQVAKILAPESWLTVGDVRAALAGRP